RADELHVEGAFPQCPPRGLAPDRAKLAVVSGVSCQGPERVVVRLTKLRFARLDRGEETLVAGQAGAAGLLDEAPEPGAERAHGARRGSTAQHGLDDLLCLGLDPRKVICSLERLSVELIDVLGAGWPRGEPAGLGDHLEAAQRLAVARRR